MLEVQEPAPGKIGAEIRLSARAIVVDQEARERIRSLVYRHKLVVLRGMSLTTHEYVAFARNFGEPQIYFQNNYHHPEHPEIFVSSNQPYEGKKFGVAGTGRYWHTDYQFFEQPLPLTMVYPQVFAPDARETSYIDMEVVHDRLPSQLRDALRGARAVHDAKLRYKVQSGDVDKSIQEILDEVEKLIQPTAHPAIIEHPVTGRRALYVSPGFTVRLETFDVETSRRLLEDVLQFVTRPEHVHSHYWEAGDILLWDNRTLLHKASSNAKREPSVSYRIGIYDGLPFYRGLAAWRKESDGQHGQSNG